MSANCFGGGNIRSAHGCWCSLLDGVNTGCRLVHLPSDVDVPAQLLIVGWCSVTGVVDGNRWIGFG